MTTAKPPPIPRYSPELARALRGHLTYTAFTDRLGLRHKDWSAVERGDRPPSNRAWELILIKCGHHPSFGRRGTASPSSAAIPLFSITLARQIRGSRSQRQMAALVGYSHGDKWSDIETGLRVPRPASWELALIKTGHHPLYGPAGPAASVTDPEPDALQWLTQALRAAQHIRRIDDAITDLRARVTTLHRSGQRSSRR